MRRALDHSEIERIGEDGENDSSNVLLIMDQPKIIVTDGVEPSPKMDCFSSRVHTRTILYDSV
jgi:hypothetical protein